MKKAIRNLLYSLSPVMLGKKSVKRYYVQTRTDSTFFIFANLFNTTGGKVAHRVLGSSVGGTSPPCAEAVVVLDSVPGLWSLAECILFLSSPSFLSGYCSLKAY